jgi:hypothetical protein
MIYPTTTYKSLLRDVFSIPVEISETAIRPKHKCECGICQNDGGICGYFEGWAADAEDDGGFVAKCARGRR